MARKREGMKVRGQGISGISTPAASVPTVKPERTSWADLALAAGVHPQAVRKFALR
ncbi:MAG: hypothetical protein IKF96_03295 [Eggerthellaceae bacterium]|nr:hypothetical protein [Eggerthellaceae bacterium]